MGAGMKEKKTNLFYEVEELYDFMPNETRSVNKKNKTEKLKQFWDKETYVQLYYWIIVMYI